MALAFIAAAHAADGKDGKNGKDGKESKEGPPTFEIRWGDQPAAALRTPIPPATSTRWCGALRKGEAISWEFNSAEPLELTVQPQDGRHPANVVKLDGITEGKGLLEVDADQNYCWIWTNRALSPVALQARLHKGTR